MTSEKEKYPEHAKLHAQSELHEHAQRFYDWLMYELRVPALDEEGEPVEAGVFLAYDSHEIVTSAFRDDYTRACTNVLGLFQEEIFARFLGIDRQKLEDEKRQMLEELRRSHEEAKSEPPA